MSLPVPAPSINFGQWSLTPADFNVYDKARRNWSKLMNLTLTGLANAIYADQAGTVDYGTNEYTEDAIRVAYEGPANPGPGTTNWRRALETALLLKGTSRFGNPFPTNTRNEGRPGVIRNSELDAL